MWTLGERHGGYSDSASFLQAKREKGGVRGGLAHLKLHPPGRRSDTKATKLAAITQKVHCWGCLLRFMKNSCTK